MDKLYQPQLYEDKIYALWEKGGYFTPKIDKKKKPFTILLPLPNASDPIHMGHALFTVEDILVRYHRMLGDPTLWLPGGDHAGIETQYVFEKKLAKEGQSRFDFDRQTLYRLISDFVEINKTLNQNQMKKLGFSLDWTRYHYSLEPKIQKNVLQTFNKLHQDGLIYRAERLANYCPKCGTAFSDLEVDHQERKDLLYYLDYNLIRIATTRPETIFADTAIAVHPQDKRYRHLVGQSATIPLLEKQIPIIADKDIDPKFGTGALKVTPAHDPVDFAIGHAHNLAIIKSFDLSGRLFNVPSKYLGLKIAAARTAITTDLQTAGKLIKTEPLTHSVGTCYRCGTVIEPMLLPQWYLKTKSLAQKAIDAVKKGKTKIAPQKRFEKMYFAWLTKIEDWNISRQIVWGPQIPAWYCLDCNPDIAISFVTSTGQKITSNSRTLILDHPFSEIKTGLQSLTAPVTAFYQLHPGKCDHCHSDHLLQETDTFDTWFLSGQWPLNTLGFYEKSPDFTYFYPTSVLDTMWDILFFWVARMMMLGLYCTGQVPFKTVHIHARVVDKEGKKMSKSRGNVLNPLEMVQKYGADALRLSLIYNVSPASDIAIYDAKIRSMRNFINKLWNIGRFILSRLNSLPEIPKFPKSPDSSFPEDRRLLTDLAALIQSVTKNLNRYRFDFALEALYHFIWHRFADQYLESSKSRQDESALTVLRHVYLTCLKLLHPFAPFITETLWQHFKGKTPLIISPWPKSN